ncbi:MAG: UDP-N-acetylglucosamine 1-carboxyvinyltransferase [Puniceicoccales bacterium]|jgi:UDP-N-acetylglucosamine 1-carboxyvinyltransferase|nr:UDP-N-acetylglucosamine 1-carboxyvinyltransferase [Puniceicoccales bacterium]
MSVQFARIWGGKALGGSVGISGSKNTCLPIIAATLLTEETCILRNVPQLTDIFCMIEVVRRLGVTVQRLDAHTWSFRAEAVSDCADRVFVERFRASVCLLGALLGRNRRASVPVPGGCKLGSRPIDIHLRAFRALGAAATQTSGGIDLHAERLRGATFSVAGPRGSTVTGTLNAILAAVLAEGRSVLIGAAREPEVVSFCTFLQKMGAKIEGAGTDRVAIGGVSALGGADFTIPSDRMEAGTFLILGLLCCDALRIANAPREVLCGIPEILPQIADYCRWEGDDLVVRRGEFLPIKVTAKPYPHFPTDLQPQMTVLASQIEGTSHICDTIFPDRFTHIDAFRKLGMDIKKAAEGTISVAGKAGLNGAEIAATDLRAGAAMYLAGLIAKGETTIFQKDYVDRGYENFEEKLSALGATIEYTSPQPQREESNSGDTPIIFRTDSTHNIFQKTSELA